MFVLNVEVRVCPARPPFHCMHSLHAKAPCGKPRGPIHSAGVLQILLVVLLASPLKSSQPFPSAWTAFGLAPSLLPDVSKRASRPGAPVIQRRSHKHAAARRTLRARLTGPTWKCAAASNGDFTVAVSTVMGLESIAKQELQKLGGSRRLREIMYSESFSPL
jgi:hypothetical protein